MKKQYNQPKLTIFHITTGNLLTGSIDKGLRLDNETDETITTESGFATNKKHPIWGEQ